MILARAKNSFTALPAPAITACSSTVTKVLCQQLSHEVSAHLMVLQTAC